MTDSRIEQETEQPQGEPAAWMYKVRVHVTGIGLVWRDKIEPHAPDTELVEVRDLVPLYTRAKPSPKDDDAVLVPRGLLGAAAHAIDKGCRGENTLAKLREYAHASAQPSSAHEANESMSFENFAFEQGWPTHKTIDGDYSVQSVALAEKAWKARAARARSVLLPSRDKVIVSHTLWVDDPKSYVDVWNAALDEVSRINGIS